LQEPQKILHAPQTRMNPGLLSLRAQKHRSKLRVQMMIFCTLKAKMSNPSQWILTSQHTCFNASHWLSKPQPKTPQKIVS
jgi:hypothetical protein